MDENSGRGLFVLVGHHSGSHPDGDLHSREATARIRKPNFKNYAGTLFAGSKTLPEIPQNDLVAQSGIPCGDVSLDVQDGQPVHASTVRTFDAVHAHGTSWYFDHASVAAPARARSDSSILSRSCHRLRPGRPPPHSYLQCS